MVQIPWDGDFKSGKSSVLQARSWSSWSFVRQKKFAGKFPFLEVQENIQQRSMTYVWKCKNTYHGVENEQNVITPPPHVFVLDFTLSGHSMNTEHSLHMLPRLKKRYRGIVCSLGTALTGYWPTEENQVRQPGRTL